MWFDGIRQPNTLYVANTSRGKDSTAMLRAIELMGWPLDMICAVDIWATQDIPAELPPMVAFKDDYDRKVLEWFGVPVTRLCATKRERKRTAPECHTPTCFTLNSAEANSLAQSKDSPWSEAHGANTLKPVKLTYEDIFYRKVSPKRERERDGRCGEPSIYGFPRRKGPWCQDRLKGNSLDRVFRTAPERGAKDKYRSLHRHRGRRASKNSKAHAQEGQSFTPCADRMGRRFVRA